MSKSKKRKRPRSTGAPSQFSVSSSEGLGHRERRKLARKEARRLKKLNKKKQGRPDASVAAADDDVSNGLESRARESHSRRKALKLRLLVSNLQRQIAKEERRLRSWTGEEAITRSEPGKQIKKSDAQNAGGSKLKGAARPATEVYPWLYPEKKEERTNTRDLLEDYKGDLGSHEDTRMFVVLHFELGCLLLENSQPGPAMEAFASLEKMENRGVFTGLITEKKVEVFIEKGDLLQARRELEAHSEESKSSPFLAWDLVLIEYISRHVLNETVSNTALENALEKAIKMDPSIGEIFVDHEVYEELVAANAEQAELQARNLIREKYTSTGSLPALSEVCTAERYFHRSISWWRDADGVFEFLQGVVSRDEPEGEKEEKAVLK